MNPMVSMLAVPATAFTVCSTALVSLQPFLDYRSQYGRRFKLRLLGINNTRRYNYAPINYLQQPAKRTNVFAAVASTYRQPVAVVRALHQAYVRPAGWPQCH